MKNAFGIVDAFEDRVARYAGSKYAVAVDCCTHAIFLSLKYIQAMTAYKGGDIVVPARTYISVPMACVHAGFRIQFEDFEWRGVYQLEPHPVFDGAKRFTPGMYQGGLHCLSFHAKKIVNIGRGGMILTDDDAAYVWLRRSRYDGRRGLPYAEEKVTMLGYHYYMTPEQAARGMQLMDTLPDRPADLTEDYPDLRGFDVFREYAKAA